MLGKTQAFSSTESNGEVLVDRSEEMKCSVLPAVKQTCMLWLRPGLGLRPLNNFENIAPTSHPFGQIYLDIHANILAEFSYHVAHHTV